MSNVPTDEEVVLDALTDASRLYESYHETVRVASLVEEMRPVDGLHIDTLRYPVGLVIRTSG
jgi:hypothetical protein